MRTSEGERTGFESADVVEEGGAQCDAEVFGLIVCQSDEELHGLDGDLGVGAGEQILGLMVESFQRAHFQSALHHNGAQHVDSAQSHGQLCIYAQIVPRRLCDRSFARYVRGQVAHLRPVLVLARRRPEHPRDKTAPTIRWRRHSKTQIAPFIAQKFTVFTNQRYCFVRIEQDKRKCMSSKVIEDSNLRFYFDNMHNNTTAHKQCCLVNLERSEYKCTTS
jgi:hypothetical protein